jgi:single-stranded DNA-binding protein
MTEAAVSFAGNLTDDPEVRFTANGAAVTNFRISRAPRATASGVVPQQVLGYRTPHNDAPTS